MNNGMSLHLGVNVVSGSHYVGDVPRLQGCVNDAKAMASIAKSRGFADRVVLEDDEATSQRLVSEIGAAAAALQKGDTFFLSFAGHGANVPSGGFDREPFDQTWVLHDRMFIDGELAAQWRRFADGVRIVVIADECHSGSVLRAAAFARFQLRSLDTAQPHARELRVAVAMKTYEEHKDLYLAYQKEAAEARKKPLKADAVAFGACADDKTTADAPDANSNGVFTGAIMTKWNGGTFPSTYRVLFDVVHAALQPGQTPTWTTDGPTNPSPFLTLKAFSLQ